MILVVQILFSVSFAAKLSGVQTLQTGISVQVANGQLLHCQDLLPQAQWFVGDFSFTYDLRVIPLHHFDMILGMDWLEQFSPMKVHWQQKWMSIPYNGSTALLQGELPNFSDDIVVHLCTMVDQCHSAICSEHAELVALLEQYAFLFAPLSDLPPKRDCDHVIPLVPGAKPIHVRPYRYTPALKDEIEQQVADMLAKGIIQPITSAFSSPVLLVRKKDGT